MSAGLAALSGAIFLGKRKIEEKPANIPFVILGTGLLWFVGLDLIPVLPFGANLDAAIAFANTNLASATSMITWIFGDRLTNKKMSALGACIGAIVGLVAITPAAGFVNLGQSAFIGFTASIISNIAIRITKKSNIDDTLDVFPSHGIGGIVGMVLTAVFANNVGIIHGDSTVFFYHLITILITIVFTLWLVIYYLKLLILLFH